MDLEWSSEKLLEGKLTAFKVKLEQNMMPKLMKSIIDIISNHTDLRKMLQLVRHAFYAFGMQLKKLKISSLTFVFQHTNEEMGHDWMLDSQEAQGKLIGILYQFLPEWVRLYARWEVFHYVPTDRDQASVSRMSPLLTWCLPLPTSPYCMGKSVLC